MKAAWMLNAASVVLLVIFGAANARSETLAHYVDYHDYYYGDPPKIVTETYFEEIGFPGAKINLRNDRVRDSMMSSYDPSVLVATDQESFSHLIVLGNSAHYDGKTPYVRLIVSGIYEATLTRNRGQSNISGIYTGRVMQVDLHVLGLGGILRDLDVSDRTAAVDPLTLTNFLLGTNVPAWLVDSYLHLDRYHVKGLIAGGSDNNRIISMSIDPATSPYPEVMATVVPEPGTAVIFGTALACLTVAGHWRRHHRPAA